MNEQRRRPLTSLGPFDVHERIGRGGMGDIWRGTHRGSDLTVAIKVATSSGARDPANLTHFCREVEAVARMSHPNIVMVFDYGVVTEEAAARSRHRLGAGNPYLVMEYASRGSLDAHRAPLTWSDLRNIATGILEGLGHAHANGVIHRDLKPGNILLGSSDDPRPRMKLADFGIAYAIDCHAPFLDDASPSGTVEDALGTPVYMAPEQLRGLWRDYGPWTDLYALGVLLWELACGLAPFRGPTPYEIGVQHISGALPAFAPIVDVPDQFGGWLKRLLEKRPRDRFQWADEALAGLESVDTGRVICPVSRPTVRFTPRYAPELAQQLLAGAGLGLFGLRSAPVVGRDSTLHQLEASLRAATSERCGYAAVLRGPSGSGTSHVAQTFAESAAERGLAQCVHLSALDIDAPLGSMLIEHFRCVGLSNNELAGRLIDSLMAIGVSDRHALALVDVAVARSPSASAEELTEAQLAAFVELFEKMAAERLVLFVLDDGDRHPRCVQLARELLRASETRSLPLLVVVTISEQHFGAEDQNARLARLCSGPRCETHSLDWLDDARIDQLLQASLPLDRVVRRAVVKTVAGNPRNAMSVLSGWIAEGRLVPGDEGFRLAPEGGPLDERPEPPPPTPVITDRFGPIADPEATDEDWALAVTQSVTGSPWRPRAVIRGRQFVDPYSATQASGPVELSGPSNLDRAIDELLDAAAEAIFDGRIEAAERALRLRNDYMLRRGVLLDDGRWPLAWALLSLVHSGHHDPTGAVRYADRITAWGGARRCLGLMADGRMLAAMTNLEDGRATEAALLAEQAIKLYGRINWEPGLVQGLCVRTIASDATPETAAVHTYVRAGGGLGPAGAPWCWMFGRSDRAARQAATELLSARRDLRDQLRDLTANDSESQVSTTPLGREATGLGDDPPRRARWTTPGQSDQVEVDRPAGFGFGAVVGLSAEK